MPRIVIALLGALIGMLYACDIRREPYPAVLLRIDSLANTDPKAALSLWEEARDSLAHFDEEQRMYLALLGVKVNDKLYVRHTSDSLIRRVTAFYKKRGDRDKLVESYYYMGRVYRDLNDAPEALHYFQKAIDVADTARHAPLLSKIYSQMGMLYDYQDVYEEAIKMHQKAYQYEIQNRDSNGIVFALRDIARAYDMMEKNDSSLLYFQKAADWAKLTGNKRRLSGILTEMGDLYREIGQYDKARSCLFESLRDSINRNMYPIYSSLGHLYLKIDRLDSADYYLRKCLNSPNIYVKEGVYEYLSILAEKQANYKESLRFMRLCQQAQDSIQKITSSEEIRKMTSLYNYQKREQENHLLRKENNRAKLRNYRLIAAFSVLFVLITGLAYRWKRQKDYTALQVQKIQWEKQDQYERSVRRIEENNRKLREMEHLLSQERDNKNALLQVQKELLEVSNQRIQLCRTERDLMEAELKRSDIYQKFHQAGEMGVRIEEEDWLALGKVLDQTYDDFTNRLRRLCVNISPVELRICYLIKISIKVTDMAKLLNRSKSSISSTRARLYKKITGEEGGANKLDDLLSET